jgi:hypothetical protein
MMLKRRLKLPSYVALFAAVLLAVASTGAGGYGAKAYTDTAVDVCDIRSIDTVNEPTPAAPMG